MLLTVVVSVLVTLYVLFCVGLYSFYYFIEVILGKPYSIYSICIIQVNNSILAKRLNTGKSFPRIHSASQY